MTKLYPFGKFILQAPDGYKTIEFHRKDYLYDRCYGFVIEAISRANPKGVFVDVGANIGDTAAFLATYAPNRIVAVEGSEEYLSYLRVNSAQFGDQVTIVDRFLRPASLKDRQLYFLPRNSTGSLFVEPVANGDAVVEQRLISVEQLLKTARDGGRKVSLVKLDTDGLDGFLVLDMMDQADCPIFFECDTIGTLPGVQTPWPEVFKRLTGEGYSVLIFTNTGLPLMAVDSSPGEVLRDLSGFVHMQHCVGQISIHYFDVWAFPPSAKNLFSRVAAEARKGFLRPYAF